MSEFIDSQGRMACTPRIRQLAHASGRSPADMLRFVNRDGFDAVELSIQENAHADAEFAAGANFAHADVMRDALNAMQCIAPAEAIPESALRLEPQIIPNTI